jgi:hypothetical protein
MYIHYTRVSTSQPPVDSCIAQENINGEHIIAEYEEIGNITKQKFLRGKTQMAKIHMKKGSKSLAINEMQIKNTLRFYFTPVRMATIKNTNDNKCW